jgi:hypothetical protein
MICNSIQLGDFLKNEALRLGLRLGHDTHYDAMNWVLSWQRANVLHRLDFQPLENGTIAVTYYRDRFKFSPKVFLWLRNNVPMFPYMARIDWNRVSTDHFPLKEEDVSSCINHALSAYTHALRSTVKQFLSPSNRIK